MLHQEKSGNPGLYIKTNSFIGLLFGFADAAKR
jgi:hypothetical protein